MRTIGDEPELFVRAATYHGEEAFGRFFRLRIERLGPRLKFLFRYVLGIKVRARGFLCRHSGQKSLVLVNFRPRALVDPEVMQTRLSQRCFVLLELVIKSRVAA